MQYDGLRLAKLNALNVPPGRAGAVRLCTLAANEHLIGISVQQLKGSTCRTTGPISRPQ